MLKVSVVVPVHNAGVYLIPCLDSLVQQTLKDIEIILVLDMPTDGSDKICEEYSRKYDRIKLIYNEINLNIGLSRNEGIRVAQGEYIGFADHDDYCDLKMFERLYDTAKQNDADVVICNIYEESFNNQFHYSFPQGFSDNEFQRNILTSLINGNHSKKNTYSFDNANTIWNQLYRNEFLNKMNILFFDNRKLTIEDVIFNIQVYVFANKVIFLPETLYHHVSHGQNTFNSYDYLSTMKIMPHLTEIYLFLKTNNLLYQFREPFAICTIKRLYTSFLNEIKFRGLFVSFKTIKKIRNSSEIQEIISVFLYDNKLIKKLSITKIIFLFGCLKTHNQLNIN